MICFDSHFLIILKGILENIFNTHYFENGRRI